MAPLYLTWCLIVCQKGVKLSEEQSNIQYKEHLNELKQRTKACTLGELQVIAGSIAETNPDILLAAISCELEKKVNTINRLKEALEREDA